MDFKLNIRSWCSFRNRNYALLSFPLLLSHISEHHLHFIDFPIHSGEMLFCSRGPAQIDRQLLCNSSIHFIPRHFPNSLFSHSQEWKFSHSLHSVLFEQPFLQFSALAGFSQHRKQNKIQNSVSIVPLLCKRRNKRVLCSTILNFIGFDFHLRFVRSFSFVYYSVIAFFSLFEKRP